MQGLVRLDDTAVRGLLSGPARGYFLALVEFAGASVGPVEAQRPWKLIILDIDPFESSEGGRALESSMGWRIPEPQARRHQRPKLLAI